MIPPQMLIPKQPLTSCELFPKTCIGPTLELGFGVVAASLFATLCEGKLRQQPGPPRERLGQNLVFEDPDRAEDAHSLGITMPHSRLRTAE